MPDRSTKDDDMGLKYMYYRSELLALTGRAST